MRIAPFFLFFAFFSGSGSQAQSPADAVDPKSGTGTLRTEQEDLLEFKRRSEEKEATLRTLERQEQQHDFGNTNSNFQAGNLLIGRERAANMVRSLQDEQFRRALSRVTSKGKQLLQENKSFQTPIAILAGAATFWFGATVRLFKGESIMIHSRVEGRSRRAEFTLESPFLNSRLLFDGGTGFTMNINRSIASINSTVDLNYNSRSQSFSTEFRHPIAPHLDFSIGATQIPELNNRTDGRARIQYQFDF
ncbi:MAG: hypothetical protein KGP28_09440 [Bdellovibrionales bacterium]|nr:hypothetical protein [Bdellovibrionales bacterium]